MFNSSDDLEVLKVVNEALKGKMYLIWNQLWGALIRLIQVPLWGSLRYM